MPIRVDRPSTRSLVSLALVLVASCGGSGGSGGAGAGPPAPLSDTLAALPLADPLSAAVDVGRGLSFVSEGGSLAVRRVAADGTLAPLERWDLDLCALAIEPADGRLFLAGGSLGLHALELCASLGAAPPGSCSPPLELVDDAGDAVCTDVAVLRGHPQGDLVLATYARLGSSQLRAYDLAPPHATRAVATFDAPQDQALAVAVDPARPTLAWVALGSGGLARVDLADPAAPLLEKGPRFDAADQRALGKDGRSCDLAIAGGFLYAAIDRGGLLEVDLDDAWSATMPTWYQPLGCGGGGKNSAYRVSAIADAGRVLVAVATQSMVGQAFEGAPFSVVGSWDHKLAPGHVDEEEARPVATCTPRLHLYAREGGHECEGGGLASARPGPCEVAELSQGVEAWRSLQLARVPSGVRAFECHTDSFQVVSLGPDPFEAPVSRTPLATAHERSLASIDGVVSGVDPGLVYVSGDTMGLPWLGVPRVGAGGTIEAIAGTGALCEDLEGPAWCGSTTPAEDEPNPFVAGLLDGARWVDAGDPAREWFLVGKPRVFDQCSTACGWTDQWCAFPWAAPPAGSGARPGWQVARMRPAAEDAAGLELSWWQIDSPPDATGDRGRNYLSATLDPRPGAPWLHLVRSGVRAGYLVCSRADVEQAALSTCPTANGRGQLLTGIAMHVLDVHPELGSDGPCGDAALQELALRCEVFAVEASTGTRWVAAVSAGYVADPCAGEPWRPWFGAAKVVFYDVGDLDGSTPPRPLRLALGPPGVPGNAFVARVATIAGRTCALVGDFGGRLLVYDVSGDALFGAPEPFDPQAALAPVARLDLPPGAFDGLAENVIDLEVDLPYAYLATGRRGLTVVDVSDPLRPREVEGSPFDTPGILSGLALRDAGGARTLVGGDGRGGLRLIGRAGD